MPTLLEGPIQSVHWHSIGHKSTLISSHQYNLKNVKGLDILMICGTNDNLASPTDYNWLREELINNGNKVDFMEFPNGHVGLLMPKNLKQIDQIFDRIVSKYKKK